MVKLLNSKGRVAEFKPYGNSTQLARFYTLKLLTQAVFFNFQNPDMPLVHALNRDLLLLVQH